MYEFFPKFFAPTFITSIYLSYHKKKTDKLHKNSKFVMSSKFKRVNLLRFFKPAGDFHQTYDNSYEVEMYIRRSKSCLKNRKH